MVGETVLGARMHSCGMVLKGKLEPARWVEFLEALATAIGMSAVAPATVCNYPVDGKGGTGQTIFLPITESFMVIDTWSDHDGAYLVVCSCRPYFTRDIDLVAEAFGLKTALKPGARFYAELDLT